MENEEKEVSKGVENWVENKKKGGLGGKDLFGKTPHNPHPKKVDEGPTLIDGKLTGKKL